MKARNVVVLLTAVLAFYLVLIGVRGIELLDNPGWAARGLGLGVVLLPVIGFVLVARELRFGYATERLGRALGPESGDPESGDPESGGPESGGPASGAPGPPADGEPDPVPRTASGRIDQTYADAAFAVRKAQTEAAPTDWRAWYRLAIAYSDARDTPRARRAMRHAIVLERGQRADHGAPAPEDAPAG